MRKVLPTLLLSLVLAAAMASYGGAVLAQDGEPQQGGRMNLVAANGLSGLDNSQALDLSYNMVAGALYEGLYRFDSDGELEAGLADGDPEISDDGLVYTFRIKPGAMFAGPDFEPREVTATDVAYGMTRALDPAPVGAAGQSWGAGYLFPIKGAAAFAAGEMDSVEGLEVIDDHTLQVTLVEPTTTFLLGLTIATSWPVPQEAVEDRGDDFTNNPVGAGPFYVSEWNKDQDITLTRNPGYVHPGLPYLDEIYLDLAVEETAIVTQLETGQADAVFEQFALSPPSLRILAQNPDITLEDSVGPRIFYLALNNDGIFADSDLRQAVAQAMTTDFTVQFGGIAKPWNELMSSTSAQSDPATTQTYPHDPDGAMALMESAGYDGTPIRIVYDVTDPFTSGNATALVQDLESVGFKVELLGQPKDTFYRTIDDPDAFDISSTYWSADYPDAQDFLSTNFICGMIGFLNISRFCDQDLDEALDKTNGMEFGAERDAALREVHQGYIDALAGIPVMEVTPPTVYGPRVAQAATVADYGGFDWKRWAVEPAG